MSQQPPSVGRVVHYVIAGDDPTDVPRGVHCAAIITALHADGPSDLFVMTPDATFHAAAEHDSCLSDGTWHWPEFVARTT